MYKMWEHSQGLPDTVSWMAHVQDNDGNTFITGNTLVAGEKANIITTKYDRSGDEIWQVTYNSTFDDNDYGTAITLDDDGNVYVAATSFISATNQYDYRTIKYDDTGTLQWTSTYNGTGSLYDIPSDIIVDASDNVYVTGGSFGSGTGWDYATIKYNSSGTQQWVSRYNYNGNDDAASGLAINNSGRIVVTGGSAQASDNWDFASVKYNQNTGVQLDVQRNTASGLGIDRVYGFTIDGDDNIYLTGRAAISGQGYNMRTVKMDSLLSVQWSKTYDAANGDDVGYAVQVDLAGYVYVTGSITNAEGILNGFTVKYNSAGTVQWSAIETANNGSDLATWNTDLSISDDNDIVIAGTTHNGTNSDIIMYIYNSDGEKQWTETWNGTGNGDDTPYFVHADFNNQIYIGGKTFTGTNDTYILVRYKQVNYTTPPDDDTDKPIQLTWFENRGQIIDTDENLRSDIKYYTQRHYPALYASDDSLFMVFSRIDTSTTTDDTLARIDIGYYNSSSTKEIHHATSNGGEYLNYFLAHTGAQGITNVQQHEKLYITELYPKVDLMYYFDNAGIKYYLIIKSGYSAQNNPIQMVINGATKTINSDTTLTLTTDIGEITFRTPDAYQIDDDGSRIDLGWDATYTSVSDRIGFGLGSYTGSKVLVLEIGVDKLLGGGPPDYENVYWSTIYGSGVSEVIMDCKYDEKNLPLITGYTNERWLPSTDGTIYDIGDLTGSRDIFINKFGEEYRESLYMVFVGGTNQDTPHAMDINLANGYIYIVGESLSDDFYVHEPTYAELYYDGEYSSTTSEGFIFRVNSSGTESDYSTYVTGTNYLNDIDFNNNNSEFTMVGRIDFLKYDWSLLDPGGDAFFEEDPLFENSAFSFIMTLASNHLQIWGTKFWGVQCDVVKYELFQDRLNIGGFLTDEFYFENVDESDGGGAIGESFDFGEGETDIYFATFSEDKELLWATVYGGDGQERINALVTNQNGVLHAIGQTANNLGETTMHWPFYSDYSYSTDEFNNEWDDITDGSKPSNDGFIVEFNQLRELKLSILFGGEKDDRAFDAVRVNSDIWITGITQSDNTTFPYKEVSGYFDDQSNLEADNFEVNSFITVLGFGPSSSLVLKYVTYFGNKEDTWSYDIATIENASDKILMTGQLNLKGTEVADFIPLKYINIFETYYNDANPLIDIYATANFISEWETNPISPVGIMENSLPDTDIKIYPNPSSEIIYVVSSEIISKIDLYSLQGELVKSYRVNGVSKEINIQQLNAGLYELHIILDNSFISTKIIKL